MGALFIPPGRRLKTTHGTAAIPLSRDLKYADTPSRPSTPPRRLYRINTPFAGPEVQRLRTPHLEVLESTQYIPGQILTAAEMNASFAGRYMADLGSVGGTLTVDVTDARIFTVTLTANVTAFTVTNSATGYLSALFAITQGGDGGYSIVYPSNFRWQGGFSPSLSTAVGATDLLQITSLDNAATWFAAIVMQAAP